jgi:HAD superfamily hydrolase (TIGR01509 family)
MAIETVIFDLDGVLLDTEEIWNAVRRDFALAHGGRWDEHDQPAVMGANSMQWAAYMQEASGLPLTAQQIYEGVIGALKEWYARDLPLIPGAREVVTGLAARYRLGVASSSPRELIEYALDLADLRECFEAVVSSDDVAVGKPAPDVYLEVCGRLRTTPEKAAAVEDSSNGIRAAAAAGLKVVAVPNPAYPPSPEALKLAARVLGALSELSPELIESLACAGGC